LTRSLGIGAFDYPMPLSESFPRILTLGARHVEVGCPKNVTPQTAAETAELAARHGITITSVGCGAKLNETDDVPAGQKWIMDCIITAHRLGAGSIFTYFGGNPGRTQRQAIEHYKEQIKPCLEAASRYGVTILMENHFSHVDGEVTNTVDGCLELIDFIDSPLFRLNYDPCNFYVGGEEYWPYSFKVLRPYVGGVHMKDAMRYNQRVHGPYEGRIVETRGQQFRFVAMGTGACNNDPVLRSLIDDGYDGPVTIEAHTPPDSIDEVYRIGLAYCRERGW